MEFTRTKKSNLFDGLKLFRYIFVTGPHRAGTTITTAMIANDLDYDAYEEPELPHSIKSYIKLIDLPAVFHCPSHCAYVHEYAQRDDTAVVMVRRPVDDIIASQQRVGWGFEQEQLSHYVNARPPIAAVKYEYWDLVQREILGDRAFEIEYEILSAHPMWVDREARAEFTIAQIEVGKPRGDRVQNPNLVE